MTHSRTIPDRARKMAQSARDAAAQAAQSAIALSSTPDTVRMDAARLTLAAAYAAAKAARDAGHLCRYNAPAGMPPSVARQRSLSRDAARYAAFSAAQAAMDAARDLQHVIEECPPLHVPEPPPIIAPVRLRFDVDPRPGPTMPTAHDLELDAIYEAADDLHNAQRRRAYADGLQYATPDQLSRLRQQQRAASRKAYAKLTPAQRQDRNAKAREAYKKRQLKKIAT